MQVPNKLQKVVETIEKTRKRYGMLKKCEFHIHTPASHDYQLIKNQKYNDLTTKEVILYSKKVGYLNSEISELLLEDYEKGKYERIYVTKENLYESLKEHLAYSLIAHILYDKGIEIAVISDHNTINGYIKLKYALEEYYQQRIKNKEAVRKQSIYLFLGVEISCSDKNHVVGIFENNKKHVVNRLLDEFISSEEYGTHETSYTIIEKIADFGGIPYIAHINSSDYGGTRIYKEKLFKSESHKILGLTNLEKKQFVLDKISPFIQNRNSQFGFIYEGDAHCLEDLGMKNSWIKVSGVTFNALVKAINNHRLCVFEEKPTITDKYIKGIYIEPGSEGFLRKRPDLPVEPDDDFFVEFSRDLNCIIGGRGTGKSTLLNIIDTVFSLESPDKEQLKFISNHNVIYILFFLKGKNYVIRFIPQAGKTTGYVSKDYFVEKAFRDGVYNKKGILMLSEHWIELFEINSKLNKFTEINGLSKTRILKEVYRKSYSINSIISEINRGRIGDFIKEVIFNGGDKKEIEDFIFQLKSENKRQYRKFIRENISDFIENVSNRENQVTETINGFNIKHQNLIKIEYSPKKRDLFLFLEPIMEHVDKKDHVLKTKLTWAGVEDYLYQIVSKIGYLEFLSLISNKKYKQLEAIVSIKDFISDSKDFFRGSRKTEELIDEEYEDIESYNLNKVLNNIYITITVNKYNFELSLERYIEITDDFTILFNVNSKESIQPGKPLMKNVEHLSLGQKVVAILTFVIQYGLYSNDNTPLIIDQPEDNLDNPYIYSNLVKSLREVKNNRQVILVTHSSTIVTNSDAEQVIVLNSNNECGWVEQKGYPSDQKVLKYILIYLEGGVYSFKHKMETYTTVLTL